jgi:hypothetical protein
MLPEQKSQQQAFRRQVLSNHVQGPHLDFRQNADLGLCDEQEPKEVFYVI